MKKAKKILVSALVASTLMNTPTIFETVKSEKVFAAAKSMKNTTSYSLYVNGRAATIETITVHGHILVDARELAHHFAATYAYNQKQHVHSIMIKSPKVEIKLKKNSTLMVVNGEKKKLSVATKWAANKLYVDPVPIVQALNGQLLVDQRGLVLSTTGSIKKIQSALNFDGVTKLINTVTFGKKTLYSVKDLATAFGASVSVDKKTSAITVNKETKKVILANFSDIININGKKLKMPSSTIVIQNIAYTDLDSFVRGLGGDTEGTFIATKGFLKGTNTNPQWVNSSLLLVTNEEDSTLKLIHVQSRKVVSSISQHDAVVSPDGQYIAYVSGDGLLYVMNLANGQTKQISNDDDVKVELTWSKDSKRLYFIHGSNNEAISMVSIDTGTITKIVDDKIKYKSDLHLSPDETKIVYTVAKEAKTNYTDDQKTDVDSIDTAGADPQLFMVDLTSDNKQPIQLTNSAENKINCNFVSNNQIIYLSASSESESLPSLKMIVGNKEETLLSNKNILDVTVANGIIYIVTEANGIYTVQTLHPETKSLNNLVRTKEEIKSLAVSPYNNQIAVTISTQSGEKVAILEKGQLVDVTK
ncbi:stalk domain-containing protein [Anoxybacteroides amylolyticum]|uniref:WD40-like Beta Propeller Repeat family protein n=1 Tax=Anoxybacteroides amylolyticum TaxID=294699 RepID=A0A160F399_9BACL|nr:stalk domain-containing protein [Anoxybacillus amylolyticus]ANB60282.1 WD40-like Beta Propeller Repeat family protein [Anoxybacillus amylolyticus]